MNFRNILWVTGLGLSTLAHAAGEIPPGASRWEMSGSMDMGSMKMPMPKQTMCLKTDEPAVSQPDDANCQVYDNKTSGAVTTFKMRCTGKDAMEGSATITTIGPDHTRTKMEMKSGQGTMVMTSENRKVGACKGDEANLKMERMAADIQAKNAAELKRECDKTAREWAAGKGGVVDTSLVVVDSMMSNCKNPQLKAHYCKWNPVSHGRYARYFTNQNGVYAGKEPGQLVKATSHTPNKMLDDWASSCALGTPAALRTSLTASAEKGKNWAYIKVVEPTLAGTIYRRECAGRKYTAMSVHYRGFCGGEDGGDEVTSEEGSGSSGSSGSSAGDPTSGTIDPQVKEKEDDKPKSKAGETADKAKKALRGIFGR